MELWPVAALVGECPFWDTETRMLFWVDIRAPRLHRHAADGTPAGTWPLPAPIGAFALLDDGRHAVVCLSDGLRMLDLRTGVLTPLLDPEPERPGNRLNEGKTSPCGQYFVFGSMDDRPEKEPTGSLYCLSASGTLTVLARDLVVANGVAWSPDGGILYFSDSRMAVIWACAWDAATGTIADRRVFARPSAAQGRPDGAAMDTEGHYWSAGVSAGRLNRFRPDGECVQSITLPVQAPTMPTFGGTDGSTLFITSHRQVATPTRDDGAIVILPTPFRGMPQKRFSMASTRSAALQNII